MTDDDLTRDPDLGQESKVEDAPSAAPLPLELALHHRMRYSGLRDVVVDTRLLLYVPLEICERETVLPISVREELLEVATAFPDPDLEIVQGRFPELEIELVFAPTQRIAALHDELKTVLS